jgi:hypothetical protein
MLDKFSQCASLWILTTSTELVHISAWLSHWKEIWEDIQNASTTVSSFAC